MRLVIRYFLYLGFLVSITADTHGAWQDNAEWYDQFYQYRIPVEVNATSSGLHVLDVTQDTIVNAINQLEVIHTSARYLNYNHVKVLSQHYLFGND